MIIFIIIIIVAITDVIKNCNYIVITIHASPLSQSSSLLLPLCDFYYHRYSNHYFHVYDDSDSRNNVINICNCEDDEIR